MCDPLTAISVGLGVMQYMGGQSAASAQASAASQQAKLSYQQIAEQQAQINAQSMTSETERAKQGMIERAQMATISGESGAMGLSSDRLIGDSFMQQGIDISSLEANRQSSIQQAEMSKKQAQYGGQATITTAYNNAPTLVGTGLQIAGDIYKGTSAAKAKAKQGA